MNTTNKTVKALAEGFKYGMSMMGVSLKVFWANYKMLFILGTLAQIAVFAFSLYIWQAYDNIWYGLLDWMVGGALVNWICLYALKISASKEPKRYENLQNAVIDCAINSL